jgi:hypothetical protein
MLLLWLTDGKTGATLGKVYGYMLQLDAVCSDLSICLNPVLTLASAVVSALPRRRR